MSTASSAPRAATSRADSGASCAPPSRYFNTGADEAQANAANDPSLPPAKTVSPSRPSTTFRHRTSKPARASASRVPSKPNSATTPCSAAAKTRSPPSVVSTSTAATGRLAEPSTSAAPMGRHWPPARASQTSSRPSSAPAANSVADPLSATQHTGASWS